MMSRRAFVKKIVAFCSFIPLGIVGLADWLSRSTMKGISADDSKNSPSNSPEAAPPKPEGPGELLTSVFLLSDLHISVSEGSMTDKLHWALKDIVDFESKVDTIVLGGDLTDFGRDSDYKLLKSVMNQYQLPPVYANMGNHDYYDIWLDKDGQFSTETMPNGKTDSMARDRFLKFFGYSRPYNDIWVGGVHLLFVSQEAYSQEMPDVGEGAWYSDEQLQWLREKMKDHADGKPAFVFIHQPLPAPGTDGRTHQLVRATEFREILQPYKNVFVLSGHTHRNFVGDPTHYNTQNSFHWFTNASVGRTRASGPNSPANVSQGLFVQVYEREVVLRGREFSNRTWIDEANWTIKLV